jgi:uncharacterized membrane protein
MATFVAIAYDDAYKAEEVRLELVKLQELYLIDMEDAVVAVRNKKGKIKLHQARSLSATGALSGGFWGALIGLIFLSPILGAVIGASGGAISGALADIGISDAFMKRLAEGLTDDSSILFVLVRKATPDKVVSEIKKYGGVILQTSLSHEDEQKLQVELEEGAV